MNIILDYWYLTLSALIPQNYLSFQILCDAHCETGVPFRNINCVIDTGITLEVDHFHRKKSSIDFESCRNVIITQHRNFSRNIIGLIKRMRTNENLGTLFLHENPP